MIRKTQKTFNRVLINTAVMLGLSAFTAAADIRFWTTEEQPARLAKQQAMAEDFKSKTGIAVEVIPVTEKDLGTRATAAFAAGTPAELGVEPGHILWLHRTRIRRRADCTVATQGAVVGRTRQLHRSLRLRMDS